ncbi:hypothetical protein ACIXCW_06795 [Bacteroides fragilis]
MMEKEQVTRMQNSDLKELLEDVTLNEIHLSNEERQEMTSTFSQIIKKKKKKSSKEKNLVCSGYMCMCRSGCLGMVFYGAIDCFFCGKRRNIG